MNKIKIGFVIKKYNSLATKYNYGLEQNTYYMVSLFKSVPEYDISYVVCIEDALEESQQNCKQMKDKTPLVLQSRLDPDHAEHVKYDLLINIECFVQLDLMRKLKKAYQTKFVDFHAGIVMWGLMEDIIYNVENRYAGAILHREEGLLDAIWTSPHHEYHKSYIETIAKTPVTIIPYLYEPWFLQMVENDRKKNNPDFDPHYRKGTKKNIAIVEPNLNLVKTCIVPVSIVERLFNDNPQEFKERRAQIYCSDHIRDRQAFKHFYGHLSCKNVISSENRYTIIDVFNSDCNIVVSHQHLCELNYLYLDALYYGLPLVHNSPRFKEIGYYYPDFDIKKGAAALSNALNKHDKNISSYQHKAKKTLYKYSTKNPDNIKGYKELVKKLIEKK